MKKWRFHFTLKHKAATISCNLNVIARSWKESIMKVDEAWRLIPGIPDNKFTIVLNEIEEMP